MLKKPLFSIVIPTLNEEKYLPLLLGDLVKQTFKDFEVIHVDGNSDDSTIQKAKKYKRFIAIKTKVVKKRNVAFQRNTGGALAKGQWIIFMDADNRLPKYFLQGLKYQLEKNPSTGVFTTYIEISDQISMSKTVENAVNLGYEMLSFVGKEVALGSMIGTSKTVISKVEFRENAQIFEDAFFVKDCIARGYRFNIFREPKYTFSLRRLRKEGSLKMARIIAVTQLNHILGKTFETNNHGYVMSGGKYYDESYRSPLINLQKFIEKASSQQLNKAKKILKGLRELQL